MTISWVDLAILGVVVLSMITGLFRGFVKETVALGVWILAFWFFFHHSDLLDPLLTPYIHNPTMKGIAEFFAILLGSFILGGIVNFSISFFMRRTGLSGTDRLFGMGFGFIRGVFIVAVLILGLQVAGMSIETYENQSIFYAKFDPIVKWLSGYVPEFIKHVKSLDNTETIQLSKGIAQDI
jgi:membrane protein required for colicin V production